MPNLKNSNTDTQDHVESRQKLGKALETAKSKNKEIYLEAAHDVNQFLLTSQMPLGPNMARTVPENIADIEAGTGSSTTMHGREVVALSKDALEAARDGECGNATLYAAGGIANTFAFLGAGVHQNLEMKHGRGTYNKKSSTDADGDSCPISSGDGCLVM